MQGALFNLNATRAPQHSWHQEMMAALGVAYGPAWPDEFGRAIRRWLIEQCSRPVTTLSLFSGGGGLDIAFHDCGFKILQMVEIEAKLDFIHFRSLNKNRKAA